MRYVETGRLARRSRRERHGDAGQQLHRHVLPTMDAAVRPCDASDFPRIPTTRLMGAARDKIEAHVEGVKAQQAEGAAAAASLVIEKDFGVTKVAIYDRGFVRVSKMMTPLTPYEKLRSIKFEQQTQDRSGVGQVWAGGPLASSQRRTLSLTIATDRKVHTLVTEHQMLSGNEKAGLALEAAGNSVLGVLRDATPMQVSVANPPGHLCPAGHRGSDQEVGRPAPGRHPD